MDIEGFGIAAGRAACRRRACVHDVADLYSLTRSNCWRWRALRSSAPTTCCAAIDGLARAAALARDRRAGHPWRGQQVAQVLASHFGSLDALMAADAGDLHEIEGIGPTIAAEHRRLFRPRAQPRDSSRACGGAGVSLLAERRRARSRRAAAATLAGITFVITGTLPTHEPRAGRGADRARTAARSTGSVSAQDQTMWWWATTRAGPSSTKRSSSASRCSTKTSCWR